MNETLLHTYQNAPKPQTLTVPNADKGTEQQVLSFIAGGNARWARHFEGQFGDFSQNQTFSYPINHQLHSLVFTQMNRNTKMIAKTQKQPRQPSVDEWINIQMMKYLVPGERSYQVTKRRGGKLHACYQVKEANLKPVQTARFQLGDILDKV